MKAEYLNPKGLFKSPFFTHTVAASGVQKLVYVSGQVSYDAKGAVIKGDMRAQSEQVFESVTRNLKAAGAGWGDVIKMNGYMVGMNPERVAVYRDVRTRYVDAKKLPASTLVGVERLVHEDLLLEVEVIAALGAKSRAAKRKKRR
jgi:enamine deaminase RidA (YjgF/YER057c/UK114 family)